MADDFEPEPVDYVVAAGAQTYRDALAENETLRQELAQSEAVCAIAMAEVEALTEERDAMRSVVDAARAVRELWRNDAMGAAEPEIHAMVAAVDALYVDTYRNLLRQSTKDGA